MAEVARCHERTESYEIVLVACVVGCLLSAGLALLIRPKRYHGEFVSKGSQVKAAIERSLGSGKPAVIHAEVDPAANVDPPGNWLWTAARTGKLEM